MPNWQLVSYFYLLHPSQHTLNNYEKLYASGLVASIVDKSEDNCLYSVENHWKSLWKFKHKTTVS